MILARCRVVMWRWWSTGTPVDGGRLALVDDGKRHAVRVRPRRLAMTIS